MRNGCEIRFAHTQDFVKCFPQARVAPHRLMPADALIRLNEVTNELLELARASRANKVNLNQTSNQQAEERKDDLMFGTTKC